MTDSSIINPFILKHTPENRMQTYCYRHHPDVSCNRQADAKQMQEIQADLDSLDPSDKETISRVWSVFSAAPASQRTLLLKGLLAQCCFPQLSQVSEMLDNLIRIDFVSALPTEISFKILTYLDSTSLCRAAQVSRKWRQLADDDVVWHRLCEQHIDKKCTKCGWGLPLLEKKRLRECKRAMEARALSLREHDEANHQETGSDETLGKRKREETQVVSKKRKTRPWKEVYSERYNIESNWRHGRYRTLEFKHPSEVMALQFDEQYLITGTFDGTVNVWDIETGKLERKLVGHLKCVTALKFDGTKLITGSSDRTVRVWNYRTGDCVCTFRGHEGDVLCLDSDQKLIASGSKDNSVKVWNFETKTCFTLRGHGDAIHSVKIHSASNTLYTSSEDATIRMWDLNTKKCIKVFSAAGSPDAHVAQITNVLPLFIDHLENEEEEECFGTSGSAITQRVVEVPEEAIDEVSGDDEETQRQLFRRTMSHRRDSQSSSQNSELGRAFANASLKATALSPRPTHLLSSSLDSTLKMWDVRTGKCVRTLFGHIEGIWSVAADNFRVISGAHDKLVKVWDLQSGRNWHTFSGHTGAVYSVGLSDTRLASGGEDGLVRMLCFDDFGNEFRATSVDDEQHQHAAGGSWVKRNLFILL